MISVSSLPSAYVYYFEKERLVSNEMLRFTDIVVAHETANGLTRIEIADPLTNTVTIGWVYSKLIVKVD